MKRLLGFILLVIVLLVALRYLPAFVVGDFESKPTDMLSDLLEEPDTATTITDAVPDTVQKTAKLDSVIQNIPPGMTPIEDFGLNAAHGMQAFWNALDGVGSMNRPVRIAYIGDSFIEGDIITNDLRIALQKRFGGAGAGFVDIASDFVKYRLPVDQTFSGWNAFAGINPKTVDWQKMTLNMRYAIPNTGAATATFYDGRGKCDTVENAVLYLRSNTPVSVSVSPNKSETTQQTTAGTGQIESLVTTGRIGSISYTFNGGGAENGTVVYGMSFENPRGIVLDNISLRGTGGNIIGSVPVENLRQFNAVRPYDLIILQFGLNVAEKNRTNYDSYMAQMKKVVNSLQEGYPQASILIISVGDRENKINGTLQTLPGIKALVQAQRGLAKQTNVAFWNLYEGMGGEGSIKRMVEANPAEANKDYTHINRRGGKRIADLIYKTLMYFYENQ